MNIVMYCGACGRPVIPLHDPVTAIKHYYHVPTVVVEEIERSALAPASGLLVAWRTTKDFLRDRLVNSGRPDVNINAVLRVMNEAFNDPAAPSPQPLPREALDVERLAREAYADRPPLGKRPVPWTPVLRREWTAWARRMATALSPDRPTPP